MHWRGNKDPVIKTEMMLQLEETDILSLLMFSHCFFTSFAFCCVQCDYWLQELMPQLYRGHTGSSSTPRWHISTRPHLARVCSQFLKDKGSIPLHDLHTHLTSRTPLGHHVSVHLTSSGCTSNCPGAHLGEDRPEHYD